MTAFVDYLHEVFERFGPIVPKRMFGGHGIYRDGLMFALVHKDALYLKADAENLEYLQAQGLAPFEYTKQGKTFTLSYYLAPAEIMEDRELAALWARRSFEAALRAQASKRSVEKSRQRR